MSEEAEAVAARPVRGSRVYLLLGALVVGLLLGIAANRSAGGAPDAALSTASTVGGLWLDALKMTVIPLVVSLLIIGIARGAQAARAGGVAARSILWFAAVYAFSATLGVLLMPLLLQVFPMPQAAAAAMRAGLAAVDPEAVASSVPAASDFFRSLVPDNVVGAAAEGQLLQLVLFTVIFGIALSQLSEERRHHVLSFFDGISGALLLVIGWVLWIAPVGIFALAFTLGAGAGGAAITGVIHYILLVSSLGLMLMIAGYGIALVAGGFSLPRFTKAMLPAQAVALSTQSSLASLPAMLGSARILGIRQEVADVTLPLAVALFRGTGSAMNIGVAFYVGHWLGLEPTLAQLAAATAVAAVVSAGSVSLPGSISFITSTAPIAMAMGVPIAPLAILVAVETIPDIFRTVGNVTLDVAVTGAVDRKAANRSIS